jgi:hypothetical protein
MDYKIVKKVLLDCFRFDIEDYPQSRVLTVAHDNDRSLMYRGKYYSPLIDTMEDDLAKSGVRCVSVARIISTIKGDVSYGKVVSPEGGFARSLIAKRLKGFIFRNEYPYSISEERVWGRILDKTGAKKVFGIQPSRELCRACHKRGIWVADVQHGVIADTHPWYGQAFRAPDNSDVLPSAFLCWDAGSKAIIDKWAQDKKITTHIIGNRWLARFVRRDDADAMVRSLCEAYENHIPAINDRKTILVSLSWGNTNIENGFLPEGLETVIKKTANRFRWLIRLHPNQIKGFASDEAPRFVSYFNNKLAGCAEWDATTSSPLPVVLQEVDLHISWNSSVSIEAAQLGIKSALLDPRLRDSGEWSDYYGHYREAGLINLEPEEEPAIIGWIERNLDSKAKEEDFNVFDTEYHKILKFIAA